MDNINVYLGDVHGAWEVVCQTAQLAGPCNIIQVGDFGVGFDYGDGGVKQAKCLNYLDRFLSDRNCKLYVIRGNHDNPTWFPGVWGKTITFLKDGEMRTIGGVKHLFIGGAISIDRDMPHRKQGKTWWADEKLSQQALDGVTDAQAQAAQVVVTHAAPNYAPIAGAKSQMDFSKDLSSELIFERIQLDTFAEKVIKRPAGPPVVWLYGHYHASASKFDARYGVYWRQLDIDEAWEIPASLRS